MRGVNIGGVVMNIALPPILKNAQGQPRKVGFEIEFTGVSLAETAAIVLQIFPGEARPIHRNRIVINSPAYGEFVVELDVKLLQRLSQELQQMGNDENLDVQLKQLTVDVLSPVLATFAPTEIVTPPLSFEAFGDLDALCQQLRAQGAKGTHVSVVYAFGVHINPEVPALDAEILYRYLLAFGLLYDWLKAKNQMDLTRQATLFAKAYPKAYVELLLNKTYGDNRAALIDDYLLYNPSRNRALDMLPLFTYIDEARVRAKVPDERVKKRPTFHYRLPNCQIDEPDWSVLESWNLWVEVEKLAYDSARLKFLGQAYKKHLNSMLYTFSADDWIAEVEQCLNTAH